MKKLSLFVILSALFLATPAAKAQEVFSAVIMAAQDVLDNPQSDDMQLKIAQFKITAMRYTHHKMTELRPNAPAHELDIQAYYMSEFLTRFFADIRKNQNLPERQRKEAILRFVNATVACPLFNDPDIETTHVYVFDDDNLTPFCLDTDWQKAVETIDK